MENLMTEGKKLVTELNKAADAYYNGAEYITDKEYDAKFDQLKAIENELGKPFPNSPTLRAGYAVKSALDKITHEYLTLSLDKTKDADVLVNWLADQKGMLSWKMDGLTLVLTYDNGVLTTGATRGNGIIGEDVSHNIPYVKGIPMKIGYKGHMVVRGETFVTYETLDKINAELPETEPPYKNCRNLASGSIRLYDSYESMKRKLQFKAFELVYIDQDQPMEVPDELMPDMNDFSGRLEYLSLCGFDIVDHFVVDKNNLKDGIAAMEEKLETLHYPTDGLVLEYCDVVNHGTNLGNTGHHPLYGMAFKWEDETEETTLKEIVWQASRSGRINPVAVFEPVELEGTTVQKATVFDVSTVERMKLGAGSKIAVYKANKIIPQVFENIEPKGDIIIPAACPVCGAPTKVEISTVSGHEVKVLYCTNDDCVAKSIKTLAHFCGRDCMDIRGASDAIVEQLVDEGMIHEFADFYHLAEKREQFIALDGLGEKSFNSLIEQIEKSRNIPISRLIPALGITGIGRHDGKTFEKELGSIEKVTERMESGNFTDLSDFGAEKERIINAWYAKNKPAYERLLAELNVQEAKQTESSAAVNGKTFVITGKLVHYTNRDALVKVIEEAGGKVAGSVSKNTNYLINNDVESTSGKNKKAKDLNIPIISEEDFMAML